MGRPPYLRWSIVSLLVVGGILIDARGPDTESYPLAARDLSAGIVLTIDDISYHDVPSGLLPPPGELVGRPVRVSLAKGAPLGQWLTTPSHNAAPNTWAINLPIPDTVDVGAPIRIVWSVGLETRFVDGSTIRSGIDGSAAVPAEVAAEVADAARRGQVTLLTLPGS